MRGFLRILALLVTLPILLASVSFAISNSHSIALGLWPFQSELILPLALMLFITLLIGFALGAVSAYFGAAQSRRRLRYAESQLRHLEVCVAEERNRFETDDARALVSHPQNRSIA